MPEMVFNRLIAFEPTDVPVLSMYLDLRPHVTGENPALRARMVLLKDRLHEIEKTLGPRGPALDSFQADAALIQAYIEQEVASETQGLAIFACSGSNLFETVEAGVPFEDHAGVGSVPNLFQLARLLDDQETSVLAVVDTNTARLFITRYGHFDEIDGPNDKNTKFYRKRSMGGWKQMHYQRNIDNNRADFQQRVADAIDQLIADTNAVRVVLAGDEVAIPLLKDALSSQANEGLYDKALRIHIRAPANEIQEQVAPLLVQAEADDDHSLVDRIIEAVRADGLGVAGLISTRKALAYGQVDTLVLSNNAALDDETKNDLIRRAAETGVSVEVIDGHEIFASMGGVGGILRYRYDIAIQP